ncbi:hypothetical protein LguiA_007478 [Lonicera macranthoides]
MAQKKLSALDQGYGSTSSTSRGEYEVFLSYRGTDTRTGFTDFLYTYLVDANIRTFRVDNELRIGEEICPELLRAIKESKISIPVFSKNYASSKWCLRELAQIVECHTNEGQMIYPIFYDVNPYEVRHQSGSYEDAFRQHKNNFDEMTIQGWKESMRKVGQLKGLEVIKETNGSEGQLVKRVVQDVLLGLKKNYTQLPDNLVGLDDHVKAMKELINVDSNGIRVVGIHGIGGLGKTTISKVIYNQLCQGFDCCCFIEDVRANSEGQNGIVELQTHLLYKIRKKEVGKINNVDEGIKEIKEAVGKKKVIIVLDDMDDIYQFDKLVGKCNWFGAGSRIIVTTRNKGLLDTIEATYQIENLHDVYGSYEPHLMKSIHSLELFSKYAFMRDSPPEDYSSLAQKVVSSSGGLPLVLVTLASLLFGKKDIALWEEKLRKLNEVPLGKVLERLRISFDVLDYGQRQIFLDIACFFIGEDYINCFYFWEACGFYPRDGLNALVLRSMIKIEDDKLRMHDQLRDLGREIVREENIAKPGKRSRLWFSEQASKLWEGRMIGVVTLELDRMIHPLLLFYFRAKLQKGKKKKVPREGDAEVASSKIPQVDLRVPLSGVVLNVEVTIPVVFGSAVAIERVRVPTSAIEGDIGPGPSIDKGKAKVFVAEPRLCFPDRLVTIEDLAIHDLEVSRAMITYMSLPKDQESLQMERNTDEASSSFRPPVTRNIADTLSHRVEVLEQEVR